MKFRRVLFVLASCFMFLALSGGAQGVKLVYDGDGNLVAKTANGVTTQYLVDEMNPTGLPQVIEESVNGVVQRRYSYGKQRISQTQLINGTWTTSYYGYDAQGNVRQLTNAAGVVTDTYDYDAFGNLVNHTGTTPNVYLYRGERYDSDLGLYYLRARWYNPASGRFMSRDPEEGKPSDPESLHKYLYAGGDPVNRVDPRGHGDMVETGEITGLDSEGSTAGEEAVAKEENCALQAEAATAALMIAPAGATLEYLSPDFKKCNAKAKLCKLGGKIGAVVIGEGMKRVIPYAMSVGARYYNPATGRFLSRDPNAGYIDQPATLHKYLYADGDPVDGLDPSGRGDILQFLFTTAEITTTIPSQLWYTCAVVSAYSLVSDTLEVLGGEIAAKAVPTLPKLIQVGCGWIAVAGVI